MSLYLCVDCGGSKTSAVISNSDGTIVGRALSGPSNFAYLGVVAFTREVHIAVEAALKTTTSPVTLPISSADETPFIQAWFGISGVDSPRAAASAASALSTLLGIPQGPRLLVANDTHLLAAPLRTHPHLKHALATIGGTGSVVVSFGHHPSPEKKGELEVLGRVGGWGWILGDEGGGFHVGRECIRQMLVDLDLATLGGPAQPRSVLKERVLERFGLTAENAMDLLTVIHLPDPPAHVVDTPVDATKEGADGAYLQISREKRLSQLPPLVFAAAFEDGDAFALRVLRISAGELARQIQILLRSPGSSVDPVAPNAILASETVICFGGSLVGIPAYQKLILDILKQEGGHEFARIEFLNDVAKTGAEALALAAKGVEKSDSDI